ncbi:MAG: zinc ribbon domain-containing protein [Acidimicrobiales bacterium]|nr:zinc ribbon domain-containing protein [Acidimicrobiales bacterium]
MPTYEYRCKSCENHFEVVQAFTDDALTTCESCGGPVRKVFGSVGISFKGSGFYKNDSRGSKAESSGSNGGDASPDAGGSPDGGGGSPDSSSTKDSSSSSTSGSEKKADKPAKAPKADKGSTPAKSTT